MATAAADAKCQPQGSPTTVPDLAEQSSMPRNRLADWSEQSVVVGVVSMAQTDVVFFLSHEHAFFFYALALHPLLPSACTRWQ